MTGADADTSIPAKGPLEPTPLAVIDWSPGDGLVLRWSSEAERLFGRCAAEALGRPLAEVAPPHPDDRRLAQEVVADLMAGRATRRTVRSRHVRPGGEVIDCEWHHAAVAGGDRAASILSVVLDVSQRRRAEEALRTSEERARRQAAELQAVLDTVPAAVWIARDPRGDQIDANRYGAELLRRPVGANVSVTAPAGDGLQAFQVLMDGAAVAPEDLPIQAAARTAREIRGAETEVHFQDGTIRYLLGNATPILDGQGRPTGSVGAFIDITERKLAEKSLREADRRKSDFLAVLSHELRNPLAPIRNGVSLLERAPPGSDAARRALEVLRRQADHMARLVDDLLDVTRINHGKLEVRLAHLDVREVVGRAWADARGLYEQRRVDLLLSESSAPLWVAGDAARLAQLVGNLLSNALKYTPPGGQVRVGVEARGGACRISVADTGVGLAPDDLERIFEPFVQAGGAPGGGGLGIGLALVRELAIRHGGTVRAESDGPGRGARFVVELPLQPEPKREAPTGPAPTATSGLAVLVVEDNADAAATLADLLSLYGHRTETAGTGSAGVAAAAARLPDVIICDVGLPDLGGHAVIRAIRAMPGGHAPFAVALTGYAQPDDREAALAAGFDAHLAKPPALDELFRLLAEATRRRDAARGGASP